MNNNYITRNSKPFLIAEISGNHKKNIKRIYKIIDEASKAGFDAIKIQTYKPDTITMNLKKNDFKILDKKSLWKNKTLFEV